MSTFIVVLNPELLVHLVDSASSSTQPRTVGLAVRAVIDQADELPEPALFAIAARIINRLAAGHLEPFIELAWRDALSAVRAALRFDELVA